MSHKIKPETVYAAALCLIVGLASIFIAKSAHSDEIYVNGKMEKAKCEYLYSEPVEIRCISAEHVCTFYPNSGEYNCKTVCFDE